MVFSSILLLFILPPSMQFLFFNESATFFSFFFFISSASGYLHFQSFFLPLPTMMRGASMMTSGEKHLHINIWSKIHIRESAVFNISWFRTFNIIFLFHEFTCRFFFTAEFYFMMYQYSIFIVHPSVVEYQVLPLPSYCEQRGNEHVWASNSRIRSLVLGHMSTSDGSRLHSKPILNFFIGSVTIFSKQLYQFAI